MTGSLYWAPLNPTYWDSEIGGWIEDGNPSQHLDKRGAKGHVPHWNFQDQALFTLICFSGMLKSNISRIFYCFQQDTINFEPYTYAHEDYKYPGIEKIRSRTKSSVLRGLTALYVDQSGRVKIVRWSFEPQANQHHRFDSHSACKARLALLLSSGGLKGLI